jgi:hypothetical protein
MVRFVANHERKSIIVVGWIFHFIPCSLFSPVAWQQAIEWWTQIQFLGTPSNAEMQLKVDGNSLHAK